MIAGFLRYQIIFILCLFCTNAVSQIKIHKHLTTEEGLVQGQISSIMQDSNGYIWFGTQDGISRWDGINFMNIQTHNGLPASQVMDIAEDDEGKIYFAAYGGGILVYNDGALDTINTDDGLLTNNISQIKVLSDGTILFAGDDGRISKLENGNITNWSEEIDFPENDVWGIYESPDGKIYFATENGLITVNGKSYSTISKNDGLITNYLWSVIGDKNGNVYIGTNLGINKLIDGKVTTELYNGKPFSKAVFKICISSDGKIYYASNAGILIEKNGVQELITENNGLAANDTWSLIEGSSGLIYFGSDGKGVSIFDPDEKLISFNNSSGFTQVSILSVKGDGRGSFYFANRDGLIKYNGDQVKLFTSGGNIRENIIEALLITQNGKILSGTKSGLKVFEDGKFKPYINKPELLNNEIYSIAETSSGELYIGTRFGVYYVNDKNVKRMEYFDSPGSIYIMSILTTEDDGIYFGSFDKGVIHYKNESFNIITTKEGLSADLINCLHRRNDRTVWVGTQNGINIISNSKITDTIDVNDGLTNNVIADINEDEQGRIFISTFNGLNIINDFEDILTVRNITYKDGLINNNCNKEASYLDESGCLWIGTKEGITKYNPANDKPVTQPPEIYLTGLEIFNEKYPIDELKKTSSLEYDQNYIKFIYTGINLSAPEKIIYEYRLSNVDKGWVRTKENSVQYTSLNDGNYIFEVKARNEWGYWSKPVMLSFTINPVWWKSWWFTTLVWMVVIGSAGGTIRYFEKRKMQKKIEALERERALEEERARISQDMHDDVATSLSEIAILSEIVKRDLSKAEAENHLNDISERAAKVIDNIGQIIWAINPRNDPLENLIAHLRHYISEYLGKANIKCSFNIPDNLPVLQLSAQFRRNIFLVVKEAAHNIVKHSSADKVSFSVVFENDKMKIIIDDNGKGFSSDDKSFSGNGLINMEKRINDIGGSFEIKSETNLGTNITITINGINAVENT